MNTFQLISAVALCLFGCALLIAGFLVPPLGIIDSSVLIAFGEILTFAGSLFGYAMKKWNDQYDASGDLITDGE